jgi:Leucine-rich repeat (LRR) protein
LQSFLKGLRQVDIKRFNRELGFEPLNTNCFVLNESNCFVLNESNELTHLSITEHANIDFANIVKNTSLIALQLSSNKLETIPQSIIKLINLKHLGLNKNNLTELPESIAKLQALEVLALNSNKFDTLPSCQHQLINCKT